MNELEDEPDDVQKAKPVEDEIKKGENDKCKKQEKFVKCRKPSPEHRCYKEKAQVKEEDCCDLKKRRAESLKEKYATVYVHEEPCKPLKHEKIPRHCFTKEEYIDFLSTPARKCENLCAKKPVIHRVLPVGQRILELAKPTKRRLVLTLEERASVLPPQNVDNLIELVEGESALTPEQAEALIKDKALLKKMSKKRKDNKKTKSKCQEKKKKKKRKENLGAGDPCLDMESAYCQYTMAQRFVRSIFTWQCTKPKDDYSDITEVILERLSELLEYTPIGDEDRKSQQMRILSNVLACWIASVLVQVAEKNRDKLEQECLRKRCEEEEMASLRAQECEEEAALECESFDEESIDEELSKLASLAASCAKTIAESAAGDECEMIEYATAETQYDPNDFGGEDDDGTKGADGEGENGEESNMEVEPGVDKETQTEDFCSTIGTECEPEDNLEKECLSKIASRMCPMTDAELPFITFAKVFDTLFCMIECVSENTLECRWDNRIHRAIYEKFEEVIKCENPELFTPRMKDVVDVVTGKIARWLRKTLDDQQIKFMEENPATVESKEVRDWSKWISEIADMADDWSSWINKVTCEANCLRNAGPITRGNWQDWTSKFESNALLWRRTYLEAVHQQHHNTMMLTDRHVCKTQEKPQCIERNIKTTTFDSVSKM